MPVGAHVIQKLGLVGEVDHQSGDIAASPRDLGRGHLPQHDGALYHGHGLSRYRGCGGDADDGQRAMIDAPIAEGSEAARGR